MKLVRSDKKVEICKRKEIYVKLVCGKCGKDVFKIYENEYSKGIDLMIECVNCGTKTFIIE